MAIITTGMNNAPPQAATNVAARGNRRVGSLRSVMLTLVSAAVAFGVLAGLIAWQANVATFNDYHTIVDQGSVSVDAALRARAAALDHMSAAATYLESTGQNREAAARRASASWDAFNEQARISWRNITDPVQWEGNVFAAADSAASDYIQQIGAMFAYEQAGQLDSAGKSFLAARETMNTRLVPALGGLEEVKVETMEATYAGSAERIDRWRNVALLVGGLLALIFLAMLLAVRRMHYRWSWTIGTALAATLLLTLGLQLFLLQAVNDARVLVREAYDNVAGTQDLAALLSQQRALDSILVFDPQNTNQHVSNFEQYGTLIEQRLCGPRDCTVSTFLAGNDTISPVVSDAALAEQSKLGLPHKPLVANVYFKGQANAYEKIRQDYRAWLAAHDTLLAQVKAGQQSAAAGISSGQSAQAFGALRASTDAATGIARAEFDNIWKRNYALTGAGQALALVFPIGGVLAAYGLWRRREELAA